MNSNQRVSADLNVSMRQAGELCDCSKDLIRRWHERTDGTAQAAFPNAFQDDTNGQAAG